MGDLKDLIMFTGVGQCGGNIAKLFFDAGYGGYFVNTSQDDLISLNVMKDMTFHAGKGCAKVIAKALEYANAYKERIISVRYERFAQYIYNMYCLGGGGGTGCGMTPELIREEKRQNPNAVIGAIVALPASTDSKTAKQNAMHLIEQLSELLDEGLIANLYVLDNNKGSIFEVNEHIFQRLTQLFQITNSNVKGIVDTSEIENVLRIIGCVNIADLKPQGNTFVLSPDGFIPKSTRGCERIVYSVSDDNMFCQEHIEEVFGKPDDFFKGYSGTSNSTVFAFGMQLPKEHLIALQQEVVEEQRSAKPKAKFGFKFSSGLADVNTQPTQPQPVQQVQPQPQATQSTVAPQQATANPVPQPVAQSTQQNITPANKQY